MVYFAEVEKKCEVLEDIIEVLLQGELVTVANELFETIKEYLILPGEFINGVPKNLVVVLKYFKSLVLELFVGLRPNLWMLLVERAVRTKNSSRQHLNTDKVVADRKSQQITEISAAVSQPVSRIGKRNHYYRQPFIEKSHLQIFLFMEWQSDEVEVVDTSGSNYLQIRLNALEELVVSEIVQDRAQRIVDLQVGCDIELWNVRVWYEHFSYGL